MASGAMDRDAHPFPRVRVPVRLGCEINGSGQAVRSILDDIDLNNQLVGIQVNPDQHPFLLIHFSHQT